VGLRILVDLRPALAGHAGIPQESRLLFSALRQLPDAEVHGLLQSGYRRLPCNGTTAEAEAVMRALMAQPGRMLRLAELAWATAGAVYAGLRERPWPLPQMVGEVHEDALWQLLYTRTLKAAERALVLPAPLRVAGCPWAAAHLAGIVTHKLLRRAVYPLLDTRGYDIFIAQTPYPGRVSPGTRLFVRYHDAVPVLQPHTVRRPGFDPAAHRLALQRNVADGAWFACVSYATRSQLLALHPEVGNRAVTVHNLLSSAFGEETRPAEAVPAVLQRRAAAGLPRTANGSPPASAPYLLMVATLEPRKNHATLLDAWSRLRQTTAPGLQLVLVGARGWQDESLLHRLKADLASGAAHLLEQVPAEELRLLYRHAFATVCPSLDEGFGYAGAEALRCGGVVVASDLPVHREVYGAAAAYYTPNTADALAAVLARLAGTPSEAERSSLQALGLEIAARYTPQSLLPRWQALFAAV
jgi:glycosyltransferase involved in cell wall biosynthesis